MKTLLYMAISADGYIADSKGGVPWSDHEWKKFARQVRACGNIIVGRKTFEIMQKRGDFSNLGDPHIVVVSRTLNRVSEKNFDVAKTPEHALEILAAKNIPLAFIGGGAELNGSFIAQALIDEIILDVEPFLLGQGIPLFQGGPLEQKLELTGSESYEGGIALHYKVIK